MYIIRLRNLDLSVGYNNKMDKEQIIAFIKGQLALGIISKEDLADLTQGDQETNLNTASTKSGVSRNFVYVLYGIGALIAVLGVSILIVQNWDVLGSTQRILVSLGISIITYVAGLIMVDSERDTVSQALFTVSAALAPVGSYVLLTEADIDFSLPAQMMTATLLFIVFGAALLQRRRNILVLITIAFASWAYYAFGIEAFGDTNDIQPLKWMSMILGISYILIGYGYQSILEATSKRDEKEKNVAQNVLYSLGTLAILGAGISIGGIFDLVFIAVIFCTFYGSVYLKNRYMLVLSSLFLVSHIFKLTGEYFADSLGWPAALIGVGFLVIGITYMTFYVNREFIK